MKRTLNTLLTLLALMIILVAAATLSNNVLSDKRLDLTENKVYSLSAGSKQIANELNEPINFYFFFSDSTTSGMVSLRNYAVRVESLLETYVAEANGNITLSVIDPKPFSEQEDEAAGFGLTAAQVGNMGDAIYFGLAATNSIDNQAVVAFFDPQQEQFLEYEISKVLYQLTHPALPRVALVTDLPVEGQQNPMTGQSIPPMTFYTQLQQFYDVIVVDSQVDSLPNNTDLVALAHVEQLGEPLKYAIDQHVMAKGKLLVFADPLFESNSMGMLGAPSDMSLLEAWGITIDSQQAVLDPQLGLDIRGPQGGVVRHPGILGVGYEQLNGRDIVTANLDTLNFSSVGHVALVENASLSLQPLIQTSQYANLVTTQVFQDNTDPLALGRLIAEQGQQFVIGGRLEGPLTSAFEQAPDDQSQHIANVKSANIIVIADADMLVNQFWVQQSNFFGQTVFTPFANNGDLFINMVDNLAGSAELISVRSRGTFSRPFDKVEALQVEAQARFRKQEQQLQDELLQIENQIAQLQAQQSESGGIAISEQEQQAIDAFIDKRIAIRQSLRAVRFELQKDIDSLGNWLKVINVIIAPLLLTLILFACARLIHRINRQKFQG